jgi:hypothetical protein
VTSRTPVVEDHEPGQVRLGRCGLCWLPVEGHDQAVAEMQAELVASGQAFHYGPGPHKSGSPQQVHGAKRGGRMVAETRRHGGATYQPVLLVTPKRGFPVSAWPERNRQVVASEFTPAVYNQYAADQRSFVEADASRHIGTWLDKDTGLVHLDVVKVLQDEAEARAIAIANGEIAYYSFEAKGEVRV